jgi:hypothetical protein
MKFMKGKKISAATPMRPDDINQFVADKLISSCPS